MSLRHFIPEIDLTDMSKVGGFTILGAGADDYAGFNFGWSDVNGDGLSDLIVCADGYEGGGIFAGGAYVVYGKSDGIASLIDFANLSPGDGFVIQGEFVFDLASRSISGAGDVNGDGIEDMFIGAFKNDAGGSDSGAAYIIYGQADPFPGIVDLYDLPIESGIKIVGEAAGDYASFWVASAGDVNGDGRNDLVMGAPQNDAGGTDAGAAYVVFGRASNYSGDIDLAQLDPGMGFKITGASSLDLAGYGVGSGDDINGDGFADILIGAPQVDGGNTGIGYVVYGSADIGGFDLADLTEERGFAILGEAVGDRAGLNIAGAGDVNGDGLGDIVIGAPGQDGGGSASGSAYVVFGSSSNMGAAFDLAELDGTNGFKIQGAAIGDETGVCVSRAGDVNGDGYDDLLIGAPISSVSGPASGVAYLLFGRADGFAPVVDLANLASRDGMRIVGEGAGDGTGRAVSAAGDMNGDGYDDIAIGSPWNARAGHEAGAAYVIYGRPDNESPTAAGGNLTVTEGVARALTAADFGFADPDGDALLSVEIASAPIRGSLLLRDGNGAPDTIVAIGQSISAADIMAGRLVYLVEPQANGGTTADFDFRVRDDGGTVAGGQDVSADIATLTIDIATDPGADDVVYGTDGDDILSSGAVRARLYGFGGNDTYLVVSQDHVAIEVVGDGYDTVRTNVSYTLGAGSEIEALEAADESSTISLQLIGNDFDNIMRGNAGANSLLGNGGYDILEGRGGDDSYLVSETDTVIEVNNGGYDTVYAVGNYTLNANAMIEVMLSYDREESISQNLIGNEADTLILGNRGDNIIDGGGGRDTMYGYAGNDIFYVDSLDDLPIEMYGEGYDTIVTSINYVMPQGVEVEVLRTLDPVASINIDLTGNKISNVIIGNAGANVIDGLGGGDDMRGLEGNDTYIVRRTTDIVHELAGAGWDRVRALTDYKLAEGVSVERLEAFDASGTAALRLGGNTFANQIYGNQGENHIEGGGGGDVLNGLGGDDTYVVTGGDRVFDQIGGGTDVVYARESFALEAGVEVEALSAYDAASTSALRLDGNSFSTTITGNAGNNVLNGGAGNDVLNGLAGADAYIIEDARNRVIEAVGAGYDTVYAQTSYSLEAGSEVEVLTVLDRLTVDSIDLFGNELANLIYGNNGNNRIGGSGGTDTAFGLGGDDTFVFNTTIEAGNVLAILDFQSGVDTFELDSEMFSQVILGQLSDANFTVGIQAQDLDDRIIFNQSTGGILYDSDGIGANEAMQFAWVSPMTTVIASDFFLV